MSGGIVGARAGCSQARVAYPVGTHVCLRAMNHLYLAPKFKVSADRLHGCTPWLARLLWLLSYSRCVTVIGPLKLLKISTCRFWLWRTVRLVRFDQVSRIVYRAQSIPSLNFWRYLSLSDSDISDSALFMISLALKDGEELPLFTIWEQQPWPSDWLDDLAGDRADAVEVGDEAGGRVVDLLRKFIGVRIAGH